MRIKLTLDELLSMGPGVWVDLDVDGIPSVNFGLTLNPKILGKISESEARNTTDYRKSGWSDL